VCGLLAVLVAVILLDSLRVWYGLLRGTRDLTVAEAPFVPSRLQPEEI
jgi:carbon starvation protein